MFFAELWRTRNTAGRALLYPRVWDTMTSDDSAEDVRRRIETSRRLISLGPMYGARIIPVDPLVEDADRECFFFSFPPENLPPPPPTSVARVSILKVPSSN